VACSFEIQVQLFDALVAPVLGYCSEVWAPTLLSKCNCVLTSVWMTVFIRFTVCSCGRPLRRSTPRWLLLRELGCAPMSFWFPGGCTPHRLATHNSAKHIRCASMVCAWFQSMLSIWNRMADLSEDSLLHVALRADILLVQATTLGGYH
jgi:hypothetical protein